MQYSSRALFKNKAKRVGMYRSFTVKLWCRAIDLRKGRKNSNDLAFFFLLKVIELRMKNLTPGFANMMSNSVHDLK